MKSLKYRTIQWGTQALPIGVVTAVAFGTLSNWTSSIIPSIFAGLFISLTGVYLILYQVEKMIEERTG